MRNIQLALILFATLLAAPVFAEEAEKVKVNFPETEIFLFDLDLAKQESALSNGTNVTQRSGYDNQPYFTKDSKTFLFSRGDDYQTDVYEYDLISKEISQVTNSGATEFSPTPTPDNKSITFVSDRSNSIWIGERANINSPKAAQEHNNNKEPIGYYAWNHKTGDILYWSQYGFSVSLVHANEQNYHFISGHAVPSTPHIIPGTDNFSFVHRQSNGQVWIKEFDPTTKSITPIAPTPGSNANYGWAPDGTILIIENDDLYKWNRGSENGWQAIANLAKLGVKGANRIAISPDASKIAIVGLPVN